MRTKLQFPLSILFLFIFHFANSQCEFQMIGSAQYVDLNGSECIQLTQTLTNQQGAAWLIDQFDFDHPIDFAMTANFGDMDGGADGLCMVFHDDPNGLAAYGISGGDIGAGSIQNSFIIEFDTWQNEQYGDPELDHVAVNINGDMGFPIAPIVELGNIEDGEDHQLRFTWNPADMNFKIYFDGDLVIEGMFNIKDFCLNGNNLAYFGYTASTGAAVNNHIICPDLRESFHSFEICQGDSVVYNNQVYYEGNHTQQVEILNHCDSVVHIEVLHIPTAFGELFFNIETGESVEVNGIVYDMAGQFEQELTATSGCDSLLTINIAQIQAIIYYDLDSCLAVVDESNNDYSEFTPGYPSSLDCALITASNVYRSNPDVNRHSCTPGMNGSIAMCVGALDNCDFEPNSEKSVVFEFDVVPDAGSAVTIDEISFFEKAPELFDWINGADGINNYPTKYGIQVIKNGVGIYTESGLFTSTEWSLEKFKFDFLPSFTVTDSSHFKIELLAYCLIGNGSEVAAWDLENINVMASCSDESSKFADIKGLVLHHSGIPLENAIVYCSPSNQDGVIYQTKSNAEGQFLFPNMLKNQPYLLHVEDEGDYRNGVTTFDLYLIQKHILGFEPFTDINQYIAADANGNEKITAADIIDLRKLILGYYDELPDNSSWNFWDKNKSATLSSKSPYIQIDKLITDHLVWTFEACKIGDINSNSSQNLSANGRLKNASPIHYQESSFVEGEIVEIPIFASDLIHLSGFQVSLAIQNLSNLQLSPGTIPINENHFRFEDGILHISWSQGNAIEVAANEVLFSIKGEANHNEWLSNMLRISPAYLSNEVYKTNGIGYFELNVLNKDVQNNESISFGISPNPFISSTILKLHLEMQSTVKFDFYDTSGKLLLSFDQELYKGMNNIKLNKKDLGISNGLIICKYRTESKTGYFKMMALGQ